MRLPGQAVTLLSRLLRLLPWNRSVALSWSVVRQCLLQPPRQGLFELQPSQTSIRTASPRTSVLRLDIRAQRANPVWLP